MWIAVAVIVILVVLFANRRPRSGTTRDGGYDSGYIPVPYETGGWDGSDVATTTDDFTPGGGDFGGGGASGDWSDPVANDSGGGDSGGDGGGDGGGGD